jgi:hypothetical protein
VLVWDMTGLDAVGASFADRLAPNDLERAWSALAGTDAAAARRAVWQLAAAAGQSLPFLKRRLQPAPQVDPARLRQWIEDLGSNQFAVRQQATRELEQLSERASPTLRQTLAGKPEPEVRQRAERLLEKLQSQPLGPDRLRTVRAVELLETIGSPEARLLLAALAQGGAGALLTDEAKASLERLAKHTASR